MRIASLLAIPLMLALTTPAFARHDDDHGNRGRSGYEDRGSHDRGGRDRGDNGRHGGDNQRGGDNRRDGGNDRHGGYQQAWNGNGNWSGRNDRDRGRDYNDRDRRDGDRGRPVVRYNRAPIIVIAPYERDYIRGYYRNYPCEYDRGFRWRPVVGVRVPYGIPCRAVPYGLARSLPYYPGYERYVVGRDIILVALATGIIVDVFFNAF